MQEMTNLNGAFVPLKTLLHLFRNAGKVPVCHELIETII